MADNENSSLPRSAFNLYTKLYIKRRTQNNIQNGKIIIEATKSWLSLSKNEKDLFIKKYKEYNTNYKHQFAEYLKNAEPYMQKKKSTTTNFNKECNKLNESSAHVIDNEDDFQREASSMLIHQEPEGNIEKTILAEPTAPKIKTARELFELVKSRKADNGDLMWSTLSNSEKQPYQKTVLAIKKDYLEKYKAYLQSLPSEKLFEHYNKVM